MAKGIFVIENREIEVKQRGEGPLSNADEKRARREADQSQMTRG
jgi:hypothetical protein